MSPTVSVKIGNQEVLACGSIVFDRSEQPVIEIGAIKARFEIGVFTDQPCSVEMVVDKPTLTATMRLSGNVPNSPFSFGTVVRNSFGKANGLPIFLSWRVSRPKSGADSVELQYSIYVERGGESKAGA
jgi:hypothetical protein